MSDRTHGKIRIRATAAAVLLAAASAMPAAALAAPAACGPRAELVKELAKRYREAPVAVGLASNGTLVEVLTSDGGATWTIMFSQPNGTSCLMAAGEEWQALQPTVMGELKI